jgi:hypothetical protein
MDSCGNSRANTCKKLRPHGKSAFVSPNHSGLRVRLLVTLNNFADRTVSYRRQIFQVSALSTFDGSLYAYHGYNG